MPPIADMITSCTSPTVSPCLAAFSRSISKSRKYPPTARSPKADRVSGMDFMMRSTSSEISCKTLRSGPLILMPTGVLMPVDSMSSRVLIGIVQALASPGNLIAASISFIRSAVDLPGSGQCSFSFSLTTVSSMESGAGSVAVSARPTLPKTDSTSGNVRRILSVCCRSSFAFVIEIPGKVVGIYRMSPSSSGGINSEPSFETG